ncbi:MAG: ribosome small subunit-dependent GTPase A [Christensenellaceae bacterium]|jgi:ribosome biogenesis GTPase|nr:ribosome small subunit-dependent GTPase A [Christensenellaceae bacterium]
MKTGRILQGIGGFYTVLSEGESHTCKLRGKFRRQQVTPTVGDYVEFLPGASGDEGSIERVLERKNLLLRPPVANLDLFLVTMAAASPEPDLLLTDRLLVSAAQSGIEALVLINKVDLQMGAGALRLQYELSGYEVFELSAKERLGIEALLRRIAGLTVGFAGQSAVGKSSLINALNPLLSLETGDLSRIQRGRHTTRRAQVLPLSGGGFLVDTPGFSLLELETRDPVELAKCYKEFAPYEGKCKFLSCSHTKEPGCAVLEAAREGLLSPERMERYALLYQEEREKWGKRYG